MRHPSAKTEPNPGTGLNGHTPGQEPPWGQPRATEPAGSREELWLAHDLICRWLATLFSRELGAEQLEQYRSGTAQPLLSVLAELGAETEVTELERSVQQLVMLAQPRLELAADFASLFLADSHSGAPPYASLYTEESGRFNGAASQRMQARLQHLGVGLKSDQGELPDHLAVMLEYLAALCQQVAKTPEADLPLAHQQVAAFLDQELLNWLPVFCQRCRQVTLVSGFYPALAQLTLAYLQQLRQQLSP